MAQKKKANWIAAALGKKGQLHEDLHVPLGQKIPHALLLKAAKQGGVVGKRAQLALTLAGFHHKGKPNRNAQVTAMVKQGRKARGAKA